MNFSNRESLESIKHKSKLNCVQKGSSMLLPGGTGGLQVSGTCAPAGQLSMRPLAKKWAPTWSRESGTDCMSSHTTENDSVMHRQPTSCRRRQRLPHARTAGYCSTGRQTLQLGVARMQRTLQILFANKATSLSGLVQSARTESIEPQGLARSVETSFGNVFDDAQGEAPRKCL